MNEVGLASFLVQVLLGLACLEAQIWFCFLFQHSLVYFLEDGFDDVAEPHLMKEICFVKTSDRAL